VNENIKKLIAYLKYLNLRIDINNSRDRFKLQKLAFLLKSMGIELNYEFKFHYYGVYSAELSKESYEYKNEINKLKSDYEINDNEKLILERLKENFPDNNILEATTTIIYENLVYSDINEIIEKVKKIKPYLSEFDIISGINLAKKLLFKKEYFTEEIKQELEAWDLID